MARSIARLAQAFDCRTSNDKTTKASGCGKEGAEWSKIRMLPGLLVLIALFVDSRISWVSCIEAQQLQEMHQQIAAQPQLLEQNAGSQSSYYGDYALVGDNLVNLGQPYYNNKRARKMSAFMPMRGRKDGRDARLSSGAQSMLDGPSSLDGGGEQFREIDGGEASILRLVRASLASGGPDQGAETIQWMGAPAPRQFANQLAARHMLVSGPQSMLHQFSATSPLEIADNYLIGSSESAGLMQAKPRRAFHPMRGKKSEAIFASPGLDFSDFELQTEA